MRLLCGTLVFRNKFNLKGEGTVRKKRAGASTKKKNHKNKWQEMICGVSFKILHYRCVNSRKPPFDLDNPMVTLCGTALSVDRQGYGQIDRSRTYQMAAWEPLTEVLLSPNLSLLNSLAFFISLSFLPALFYTGKQKFPFSGLGRGLSSLFLLLRSTPRPKATWGRRASFSAQFTDYHEVGRDGNSSRLHEERSLCLIQTASL